MSEKEKKKLNINPELLLKPGNMIIYFLENNKKIIDGYEPVADSIIGIGFPELNANVLTDTIKGFDIPKKMIKYGDFKIELFNPAVAYIREILASSIDLLNKYKELAEELISTAYKESLSIDFLHKPTINTQFANINNPFEKKFIFQQLFDREDGDRSMAFFTADMVDPKIKGIFKKCIMSHGKDGNPAIRGETIKEGLENLVTLVQNEKLITQILTYEKEYYDMQQQLSKKP